MKRIPTLFVGSTICVVMLLMAFTGWLWTPYDPLAVDSTAAFASPSWRHALGTDQLGRDILSTLWDGARTSLFTAVLAAAFAMVIGGSAGIMAASSRRFVDEAVLAISTVFVAFPALLLGLLVVAARGPSTTTAIITVAVAAGASVSIVTRRDAVDVMRANYVLAARYSGASTWAIVKRHVVRNVAASLTVQATGAASLALIAESTLSYLGLGTTPPTPSWGRMLASTQQYLLVHPLVTLWPAVFICLTVLGINLLGDGLRERFDPNLRTQLYSQNGG